MFIVLRQRNFALLWVAGCVSLFGDWVLFVALPFFVYQTTGSALATGAMYVAQTVPRIILGSLAGVMVDRWNRKYTLIAADLLRFALLLLLLLVHARTSIWIVYVVATLESALAQFFLPAKNALLPLVVRPRDLVAANALNGLGENLARVVGPALGGGLLALLGLASGALLDSISFLISGVLLMLVTVSSVDHTDTTVVNAATIVQERHVWREWWQGIRLVGQDRRIAGLFAVVGIVMLAEGMIIVLLTPFVALVMHGTSLTLGWLMMIQGVGGFLGSFSINYINKLVSPFRLIALLAIVGGILRGAVVLFPFLSLALILLAFAGIAAVTMYVTVSTSLQKSVANRYLGRIFGAFSTVQSLLMLCGMTVASALGDHLGIVPIMLIACSLYTFAGVFLLLFLRGAQLSATALTPIPTEAAIE